MHLTHNEVQVKNIPVPKQVYNVMKAYRKREVKDQHIHNSALDGGEGQIYP